MIGGAALAAVAAIAIPLALLWPRHSGATPPAAVSNAVSEIRACLLSDAAQPSGAQIFADLQQAARTLGALAVQQTTLPPRADDAAPLLAGLIQQRCTVIVAVGPLSIRAAEAAAGNRQTQGTTTIAVTDDTASATNLTTLPLTGLTADRLTESLGIAIHR